MYPIQANITVETYPPRGGVGGRGKASCLGLYMMKYIDK